MRRITSHQFRKLGSGGRKVSKGNIERLEKGLAPILSEDQEAEALNFRLLDLLLSEDEIKTTSKPGILEYSHNPSETGVSFRSVQAKKNRLGVRKGVPDYWIAFRNEQGERSLLWIELKKARGPNGGLNGSDISDDQIRMVRILDGIPNVAAHFAHGHEEAIGIVESYIFTS